MGKCLSTFKHHDQLDTHQHTFKTKVFKDCNSCQVCRDVIWNEARTCKVCKLTCHRKCEYKVSTACKLSSSYAEVHSGNINNNRPEKDQHQSTYADVDLNKNKMTSHTHPEVSRQTSRGESHLKYSFDLDVDYITERLIAVSFPAGGLEAQYCSNLHEVVGMLKNRHQDKYVIFNLSQRRHDLAQLGSQVYDLGWPDHLAPSLEKLCSICKHIETWFKQDPHHVVVLHCKGGRAPIGVIVLAYMNYISITSSAETGMDRYAMKRFLDAKTESAMQPSQHRYVNYFTGLLNKSIHVNSAPLFLHHVLIHGVPNYDIHGGCRPFLRIYQGMQHIHTSGVYTVPEGTSQFVISLEQALPIRGDILVKCYHKRSHATSRDVIFRCQFHTTAIVECRLVFQKADLDDAVTDGRFPTFTKVELVFSHTPDQLHGSDYVAGSNFPVDESYDPLVRWDSYEHFDKVVKGGDSSPDVIGLSGNINNNIPHRSAPDGSLYAEVQKTPSPIQPDKRFFSTPSQAAPISPMSSQLTPQMASAEDFKMAPLSSMQTTQMAVLRAKRNVQMDPGYQTTKARSPSPRTPTSDPPSPLLPTAPVPPASNGPQRPTDLLNGPKSTDSASTKRRPMNYKEQRELDDLLRGIGDDAPAINSPGSIASGQEIVDERKIVDVQAQMSQLPRMDPSYSSTPKTYPSQHPSGPREPENPYAEITDTTPKRNMAPLQFPERSNATVEEAITPTRVEKVEAFPAPSLNEQRTPQLHDNPTYAVTKNERSLPHRGMERTQDTVDSGDTKVMVQQANPHQADTWQPQPLRAKKEQILFIYKEDPTSPRGPQGSPAGTQGTPAVPQVSPAGLQGSPAVPQVSPAGPQVSLAGLQGSPAGIQGSPAGPQVSLAGLQGSPAGIQGSPAGPQVSLAGLQGSPAGLQGTQAGSQVSPRGTDSAPRVTESTARQPQPPEQPTKQPDSRESTEIGDDAMTWLQRQQQKLKEKRQREGGPPPPVFQTARRESQPEQYQAQYMPAPPSAPSHERAQTAVPQHMPASREEPSTDAPTWLQQKQKKLELKRGQAEASSTPLFIDTSHQKPSHNVAPSSTRLDNRGLNRSPPKQLHLSDLDKSVNQCPDGQSSHPPTAYGPITPPNTYEHETNPLRAESWQSHQRALSRQMSDITHDREKAASQRHPDPQPASHAAMGDALTSLPPAGPSLSTSYKESAGFSHHYSNSSYVPVDCLTLPVESNLGLACDSGYASSLSSTVTRTSDDPALPTSITKCTELGGTMPGVLYTQKKSFKTSYGQSPFQSLPKLPKNPVPSSLPHMASSNTLKTSRNPRFTSSSTSSSGSSQDHISYHMPTAFQSYNPPDQPDLEPVYYSTSIRAKPCIDKAVQPVKQSRHMHSLPRDPRHMYEPLSNTGPNTREENSFARGLGTGVGSVRPAYRNESDTRLPKGSPAPFIDDTILVPSYHWVMKHIQALRKSSVNRWNTISRQQCANTAFVSDEQYARGGNQHANKGFTDQHRDHGHSVGRYGCRSDKEGRHQDYSVWQRRDMDESGREGQAISTGVGGSYSPVENHRRLRRTNRDQYGTGQPVGSINVGTVPLQPQHTNQRLNVTNANHASGATSGERQALPVDLTNPNTTLTEMDNLEDAIRMLSEWTPTQHSDLSTSTHNQPRTHVTGLHKHTNLSDSWVGTSLMHQSNTQPRPQALPQTSKDTMKDAQDNANLHIDEASIEEPLNLEGRVADRIANFTSKMGDQPKSPPATGPRVSPAKAKPVTRRTPHQSGYDSDTAIQQYYDSPSPRPTAGTPERWLQNPGGLPVQESEYWSRSEGLKSPNPREQWARKPEYDVASSNESLHNGSVTPRFPVGPKAYKNMVSTPIAIVGRPPHAPDAPYPLSPIRRDDRDVLDTSGLHISPSQQMAMPNTAEPLSVESPASTAAHAKSPPTPEVITVTHRRIVQTERFFNQNGPQETPSAAMVGAIEALPQQQQQPQREELPQQPQSQALQQHVQPQMQQQSPQQWQQLPQQPPPSQQQHLLQQQQQLPQKQQQLPQKQQQLPQQQMPQQQLPQQQLPQQQLPQQQLPQQQLPQQQLPQQQLPKQQLPQQQLPQQQLPQQQLPQQQLPQQQLPQQQLPQQQLPQQQLPQQQLPQQQLPQQQPPQPILGKVERVATPTGPVEFNSEKNLVENGQHYPVEAKMERVPITKYSLQEKQDVAGKPSGQQYSSYGVTTTKKEVTFQDARGGVPERPTSPQALAGTNAQQVGQVPVEENVVPTVKKPVEAAPTWPIELEVRIKNEGMGPAIGDVQVQGAAAASNSPQQVSPNAQAWTASRQEPVIVVEKIQEDHVEPEHSSHMMNLASQPPPPQYPTYSDRMKNRPPGPLYPTFSDRHRKAGAGRLEEVSPNVANGYHTMYDNRGAGKTKRASTGSDGMWSAQSGHHRMPSDGGLGPPASGRTTPSNFYLMQHPSPYSSSMSLADTSVDKVRFVKDLSAWWYKPHISRDEAIGMLKDKSPGQFVVRDSNSFPGAFGLAVKVAQLPPNTPPSKKDPANELVRHFLIEPNPRGVRLKGCANEPIFGSLSALIYQHTLTQLALPCKLQLPESDPCGVDTTDSAIDPKSAHALLSQGAACNVQYLGTMEMESLTGSSAVSEATRRLFKLKEKPKRVLVHFKVSLKGITLTDNHRKLFFRRHYPVESVLYCGTDSGSRKWKRKDGNDESLAKIFGFVNRKPGSKTDNQCHLFAEYELEQPASAIVSFVTKVLLGSAVHS